MNIKYTNDPTTIDWERLAEVFRLAPLGNRPSDALRAVFHNSPIRCLVWDEEQLIGSGRAISDGVRYSVIFDVVLLPDYQGREVGRKIMQFITDQSKAQSMLLFAVAGKEAFYAELGHLKMKTAMATFPNPVEQQSSGYIE